MDRLDTLSPLDGRYRDKIEPLINIFSEKGLMQYRIMVEGEYLIALSEHPEIALRPFTESEKRLIRNLQCLTIIDARIIKLIEMSGYRDRGATHHDVKAIEYFMKDHFETTTLRNATKWVHFALTSEDITNIAYGLMLSEALGVIIIPLIEKLHRVIEGYALEYKDISMLGRTHEQPASPTTLGKEFKVFAARLTRQVIQLRNHTILTKLNGAVGNYNAHYVSYPKVNWIEFTKNFIESFNRNRIIRLEPNLITTQIEPHDTYAELFDILRRLNTILLDFQQDIRRYISDNWLIIKSRSGEIGSSTMPHKINPKEFENAKGNLILANAILTCFSSQLPVSLLQRELFDSTIERNFGTALGYSLVGYTSILDGLGKITVNKESIVRALEEHPEITTEALQTILRREGYEGAYEKLYQLVHGQKVTKEGLEKIISGLAIPEEIKNELKNITINNYTGLARQLVGVDIN